MKKEALEAFTQPESNRITKLSFGSIVSSKENPHQRYLILDTKGIQNIHGSLIESDENGRYITAGGGGTMSLSDFGFFVEQLSFEETMELIQWGWERRFKTPLPADVKNEFIIEAGNEPLIVE